jgi:hypothetical protein
MDSYKKESNSKVQKTHWCFILSGEDLEGTKTTSREGIMVDLDGIKSKIYIGPIVECDEGQSYPHRRCLLSIQPNQIKRNCRINKAVTIIAKYLEKSSTWQPKDIGTLSISVFNYLDYVYKTIDFAKCQVEKTIKRAIFDVIESGLTVTTKRVKQSLIKDAGAQFTVRNKHVLDLMLSEMELYRPQREIPFTIVPEENMQKAFRTINIFNRILTNNLRENHIQTNHSIAYGLLDDEVANLMTAIALLPIMCNRWMGGDNLPGLYLWGTACTGKSHLFKELPYYRKVATDAQGVSRFKLQGEEAALLLDDIKAGFLTETTNTSTLRLLLLGGSTTVKILGDTQDIRAFIVATSNDEPAYLGEKPTNYVGNWERNSKAWRRRFLTLECTQEVDLNVISVQWSHTSAKLAARAFYMRLISNLPDKCRKALLPYTTFIENSMDEACKVKIAVFVEEETAWLEENLPILKVNVFNALMKK